MNFNVFEDVERSSKAQLMSKHFVDRLHFLVCFSFQNCNMLSSDCPCRQETVSKLFVRHNFRVNSESYLHLLVLIIYFLLGVGLLTSSQCLEVDFGKCMCSKNYQFQIILTISASFTDG